MGTNSRKLVADYDSVACRTSSWKLAADVDHETNVPNVFESVSWEQRDRDLHVVHSLKDRQSLHKFLERKAEFAVRGEKLAQQRSIDAEAKHLEKRKSDIALYDSADQAQKREDEFVWSIGNEEETLPRKSRNRLPRN